MAYVMTQGGSTGCNHGGTATLSSSSKLTIGGNPVIVASDVPGWSIAGCGQTDSSKSQVPCASFVSFTGKSTKLTVGGQAVVLDSFSGTTNGKPDSSGKSASAGQSKFSAV